MTSVHKTSSPDSQVAMSHWSFKGKAQILMQVLSRAERSFSNRTGDHIEVRPMWNRQLHCSSTTDHFDGQFLTFSMRQDIIVFGMQILRNPNVFGILQIVVLAACGSAWLLRSGSSGPGRALTGILKLSGYLPKRICAIHQQGG